MPDAAAQVEIASWLILFFKGGVTLTDVENMTVLGLDRWIRQAEKMALKMTS